MNKLIYEYYCVPFVTTINGEKQEHGGLVIYDTDENNVSYLKNKYTINKNTIEEIKDIIKNSNVLNIDKDDLVDEHAEGMDNSLPLIMDGIDYHFNFFGEKIFEIDNIHYYMDYVDDLPAHKTIKNTVTKIYALLNREGIKVDNAFEWDDED